MHAAPWPERACAGQPPRALSRPRPRCAACWRPTRGTTPQPCAERAARARAAVAGPHQGAWGRACRQCYGGAADARGGGGAACSSALSGRGGQCHAWAPIMQGCASDAWQGGSCGTPCGADAPKLWCFLRGCGACKQQRSASMGSAVDSVCMPVGALLWSAVPWRTRALHCAGVQRLLALTHTHYNIGSGAIK